MAEALLWVSCLLFLFILMMIYRNQWVYDHRMNILETNFIEKMKLINDRNYTETPKSPSLSEYIEYNEMLLRFWVWDIEKLRKNV